MAGSKRFCRLIKNNKYEVRKHVCVTSVIVLFGFQEPCLKGGHSKCSIQCGCVAG